MALAFLLRRQLQPTRLGAGRDDHGVCEVAVAGLAFELERPVAQIDLAHVVADELGPHMLGLLLHLLHQPGTLDDVCKARIVLDIGGDGELATGLDALKEDRLQHGAGGIDRGRIARRPGADDDELGAVELAHREQTPSCALRQSACSKGGSRFLHRNQGCADGVNLFAVRALTVRRPDGPPTVPFGLKARCATAAAGSDAHRCYAQFRSSWELCNICRPECHNVVNPWVRKVVSYRSSNNVSRCAPALLTMREQGNDFRSLPCLPVSMPSIDRFSRSCRTTAVSPMSSWRGAWVSRPRPACGGCAPSNRPATSRAIVRCSTRSFSATR